MANGSPRKVVVKKVKTHKTLICSSDCTPPFSELCAADYVIQVYEDGKLKLVKNKYGPRSEDLMNDFNSMHELLKTPGN